MKSQNQFDCSEHPEVYTIINLEKEVLDYVKTNFAKNTYAIYRNTFKQFIHFIGNIELRCITIRDIENFKAYRLIRVNKSTCNIDIRTLKATFNIAKKWSLIDNNPLEMVKQLRTEEKEILYMNKTELMELMCEINDKNLKDIISFTLNTGIRISELINIQWGDVDLKERILTIKNKKQFNTKSKRNRKIPLNDKAFKILNGRKQDNDSKYVFKNKCSRKFSRDHLTRLFKKYVRKAGLPEKFHFHCLRHTFITELIKNGVNINYVKELAGHSDIKTTMNYIHLVTNDLRKAVNSICS